MIKVGVTGGIGSGKTVVCKIFESLEIPVFYADTEAKKLYSLPAVKGLIKDTFGESVFTGNEVDFKKMAALVFADKIQLKNLNSILHPLVHKAFEVWAIQYANKPYVIKEAALLFESGADKILDTIITVVAPFELRINRVIQRDNILRDNIIKRMENQLPDEEKIKYSDYVIHNDDEQFVLPQVLEIHNKLIKK
jgi:dephospho-CoA kinase